MTRITSLKLLVVQTAEIEIMHVWLFKQTNQLQRKLIRTVLFFIWEFKDICGIPNNNLSVQSISLIFHAHLTSESWLIW